ncbi:MAG: hypothetical protein E7L09_28990, partial [Enterobacteriaceae bacterium]|nr:hypothetical protein [Enterobacteriaceae bacterium]
SAASSQRFTGRHPAPSRDVLPDMTCSSEQVFFLPVYPVQKTHVHSRQGTAALKNDISIKAHFGGPFLFPLTPERTHTQEGA